MALIKCIECGKEISDRATACPHCGCPIDAEVISTEQTIQKKKVLNKKILFAIAGVVVCVLIFIILTATHVICLKHHWSEPSIREPKTCYRCGRTDGEPKALEKIEWPNKGFSQLLPEPESDMGEYKWDRSDSFNIYIGETSREDYNEYVSRCFDYGFNIEYYKYDDSYSAKDINGNELRIYYYENDIMEIHLIAYNDYSDEEISEENSEDSIDDYSEESSEDYMGDYSEESSEDYLGDYSEDTTSHNDENDNYLASLTDEEIEVLAVQALYSALLSAESGTNIDAASCKYSINKYEYIDEWEIEVYGIVYFYDKHGSITKYGYDYDKNFTVSLTEWGDVWFEFDL